MEYCPRCQAVRNMKISKSITKKEIDGEIKKIEVLSYHCEECHFFVKSEENILVKD